LPHSIDRCSSGSPGSTSRERRPSRARRARFASSRRPGLKVSLSNSLRASAIEFSEPATAIQTDAEPLAGSLTL